MSSNMKVKGVNVKQKTMLIVIVIRLHPAMMNVVAVETCEAGGILRPGHIGHPFASFAGIAHRGTAARTGCRLSESSFIRME